MNSEVPAEEIPGGVRFPVPAGDPHSVPAARLHVVCVHHSENDPLATYWLSTTGHEFTVARAGFRVEDVSDKPMVVPDRLPPSVSMPVGVDPTTPGHVRHRFTCPRPSCTYDAAVRCDGPSGQWARVTETLERMRAAGVPEMTVTGVDAWPWRVVTT